MKKLYILLLFMVCAGYAQQQPFITTWEVQENGPDNGANIKIPIVYDQTNDYTVNFGDGTILENQLGSVTHNYITSGTYTVIISGNFKQIKFEEDIENSRSKIRTIEQWGSNVWQNLERAFSGCTYLTIQAIDSPNLSQVTNMSYMFYACFALDSAVNNWDVSNVTNMKGLFAFCDSFNQPLNSWDVSNVTNMESMFEYCSEFNQPLNNWNTSNVSNMKRMFQNCNIFNQSLNNWDTSNVTDMRNMFCIAESFNQPLNNWDVSNVSNMDDMFLMATMFNQPLNDWNISNLGSMWRIFGSATSFNQPLNNWDVSNVFDFDLIFYQAESFNQDLSGWNFTTLNGIDNFVAYTNLDETNYDALLHKFSQLEFENILFNGIELSYCNSDVHNYLTDNLGWTIYDDGFSENCLYNTVAGTMLIDENQNGCDANDAPAVNFMVQATNGTYNYGTFVNNDGAYDLRVQEDIYTITPVNVPDYFTVTPPSAEVTFTGFGNSEALNFCLMPNQSIQDLNITILPVGDARPGFESEYKVLVENIGTQTVNNATVSLTFDNSLQSFVSALPAPASNTANQLTFSLTNLGVFETKEVNLTMTTFVPPIVNGGEVAVFTASVTPDTNDNTPDDNTFILNQTIVNSFDPNDKRVVQGEEIYMEQTDEYLDYIIRFQNTGTASAITVRVEDVLSEKLDWTTLKPIASSHAYRTEVTEGNKVNFIFDNINLPHEAANAEGSNGFIAYKIKPKQDIQLGDVISGDAGIYFDFNLPIITNMVTTTVVEPLGIKEHVKSSIIIYPNPASTLVHIHPKTGTQVQQVTIYNLQGRELMQVNGQTESIDVSTLSAGVYLLAVKTNTGLANYKLVKK